MPTLVQKREEEKAKEEEKKVNILIPRRKRHSLTDWFMMKEQDVLNEFASLKGAITVGKGDESFVYVPPTRENAVLLVAHADTVWNNADIEVGYYNNHYFSTQPNVGIGADDRAGCAILWKLRDLGHGLLIPNGEENGCIGSRFLMRDKEWKERINKNHQFAIEMDRMHENDLVFYDVGSEKFTEWCESNFKGYKKAGGSFTDIRVLCDPLCGLNISIGYYYQHSDRECLNVSEWNRTLSVLRNVLSKQNLPRFEQDPKPVYEYKQSYRRPSQPVQYYNNYTDYVNRRVENHERAVSHGNNEGDDTFVSQTDSIVVCVWCDFVQDVTEWTHNDKLCLSCGKEF